MRVEELESVLTDLGDEVVVDTSTAIGEVRRKAARQRRGRRVLVASVVMVGLIVAASGVALIARNARSGSTLVTAGSPPMTLIPPAVPAGWRLVDYGDARLAVPADWPVFRSGSGVGCGPASSAGGVVLLGTAELASGCAPSITVVALGSRRGQGDPSSRTVELNGLQVVKTADGPASTIYDVPSLSATVTVSGPQRDGVASTLTASSRLAVLADGAVPAPPSDWQTVTFDGVTLKVPPTWATTTLGRNSVGPGCGGGSIFSQPSVILGAPALGVSCPPVPDVGPPTDGVWIVPYDTGATSVTLKRLENGTLVLGSVEIPVMTARVVAHGRFVDVVIGLGPESLIARTILHSIRTTSR